jgi:hypothetical protein
VARRQQYWPAWAHLALLTLSVLALMTLTGCGRPAPVVEAGAGTAAAHGTISGTVRGPEGSRGVEGRLVEVVNVDTNERQRISTNRAGGFTVKVRPGKYRVELSLRHGEALVKQPGVMNVNRREADAHADFVIGTGRLSRPRGPAYRTDHGLGSPIA